MSFAEAVSTVLVTKYADFSGRARRSEFWWYYLAFALVMVVAAIVGRATTMIIYYVVALALAVPFFALQARRLHDHGRSGWWYLIAFTIIGSFVLLYWYIQDGEPGTNKYGPSPKGTAGVYDGPADYGQPNPQWGA